MSTWPERARVVTPEERAIIRDQAAAIRTAALATTPKPAEYGGEHFRKAYGLWLEDGEPDAQR